MTPLQIETLTPPPPPAMGPAEAAALLAYLQAATDVHSPGVSSGERALLCAAVGWLRVLAAPTERPHVSPFSVDPKPRLAALDARLSDTDDTMGARR